MRREPASPIEFVLQRPLPGGATLVSLLALACAGLQSEETPPVVDRGSFSETPIECRAPEGQVPPLALELVATGLDLPSFAIGLPGEGDTLLVLEQPGVIALFSNGERSAQPFLDLTDRVHTTLPGYSEWGLLGLTFHPNYEANGRFFVHYSSVAQEELGIEAGDSVIAEFQRTEAQVRAGDPLSETQLLVVPQPEINHNGGGLEFSPSDGMLYIGFGDGGGQGDPEGSSRNLDSLLGKMLRIDVDREGNDRPYGIPEGNMRGPGVRPELWSYGLRNPWRFSFDPCSSDLYLGDVGQTLYEEINVEPSGLGGRNYGWDVTEGRSCFNEVPDDPEAFLPSFTAPLASCDTMGITFPVEELSHVGGSCSITAGYVYRGSAIPALRGTYLYSDYCSGVFRSFRFEEGEAMARRDLTRELNPEGLSTITSFGLDNDGELYVMTHSAGPFNLSRESGALYRVVAATPSVDDEDAGARLETSAAPDAGEISASGVGDAAVLIAEDAGVPVETNLDVVSFVDSVAPILQQSCQPCHAENGIVQASASLDLDEAYADAVEFSDRIVARIIQQTMPPACVQDQTACVSDEELATIEAWVDQGMVR